MPVINNGVLDGARRISGRFRDLVVDGALPGAPLGYRLRGATASGAPASGTFTVGDVVADRTGKFWMCTTAGTPGTWTQIGGGGSTVQNPYLPGDDALLAASWDPAANSGSPTGPQAGFVHLARIVARVSFTASSLNIQSGGAASGSSTGSFAGLYRVSGTSLNRIAVSNDIGTSLTGSPTGNAQGLAFSFTATAAVSAGDVLYAAIVVNMTGQPAFWGAGSGGRTPGNVGVAQNWPRVTGWNNSGVGGVTALPASGTITTSNLNNTTIPIWMGLS